MSEDYPSPDWRGLCRELLDEIPHESPTTCLARAALAQPAPPAEALAARPLLERVARMGDCIGATTVGEITSISDRAAAWLRQNPPGQPVAIEPRGCPTPGACSCVEPAPPAEGDVGELVRRLKYAKQNGNSIPSCIYWGLDDGTEHQGSIYVGSNHADDCARAADLLSQRHPAPVAVSERLPGAGDFDGEGRCWWFTPKEGNPGPFRAPDWSLYAGWRQKYTHWLPADALPLPD